MKKIVSLLYFFFFVIVAYAQSEDFLLRKEMNSIVQVQNNGFPQNDPSVIVTNGEYRLTTMGEYTTNKSGKKVLKGYGVQEIVSPVYEVIIWTAGNWENGQLNGHGTKVSKYTDTGKTLTEVGVFKNDLLSGKGKEVWSDGAVKEGEWVLGELEGYGISIDSDGSRYEGQWKSGRKEGFGVEIDVDGSKYEGEWKNGRYDGYGEYTHRDGTRYVGTFSRWEYLNVIVYNKSGYAIGEYRDGVYAAYPQPKAPKNATTTTQPKTSSSTNNSSTNSNTTTCTCCGGMRGVNTALGFWPCPCCNGSGTITLTVPLPTPSSGTYYPNEYVPSNSSYSSSSSSTSSQSNSTSTSSSSHPCGSCGGSGWYRCACESAPNFGQDRGSHRCPNCGEEHRRGAHSCKCRQCNGTGRR